MVVESGIHRLFSLPISWLIHQNMRLLLQVCPYSLLYCHLQILFLQLSDYTNFFEKVILNEKPFRGLLHAQLEAKTREELKEGR